MQILSLIYEAVFFLVGIYLFIFSIGKLPVKDEIRKQKVEEYRISVQPWMLFFAVLMVLFYGASFLIHLMGYF